MPFNTILTHCKCELSSSLEQVPETMNAKYQLVSNIIKELSDKHQPLNKIDVQPIQEWFKKIKVNTNPRLSLSCFHRGRRKRSNYTPKIYSALNLHIMSSRSFQNSPWKECQILHFSSAKSTTADDFWLHGAWYLMKLCMLPNNFFIIEFYTHVCFHRPTIKSILQWLNSKNKVHPKVYMTNWDKAPKKDVEETYTNSIHPPQHFWCAVHVIKETHCCDGEYACQLTLT